MTPEIADKIEILLDYVERWNKNDAEKDVAIAASEVEAYLATYRDTQ